MEFIFHDSSPYSTRSPEFSNLFQKLIVTCEEEGQSRCKLIDAESSIKAGPNVLFRVRECVCKFLNRVGACLPNVVAAYAEWIPHFHLLGAEFNDVYRKLQRAFWRKNIRVPRYVLFQNIVLRGPPQCAKGRPLRRSHDAVHCKHDG